MPQTWLPQRGITHRLLTVALAALLAFATLVFAPGIATPANADDPTDTCGVDVVFVLDASYSMTDNNDEGIEAVRDGVQAFIASLTAVAPASNVGIVRFGTSSAVDLPYSNVASPELSNYIANTYEAYSPANWTNWDRALNSAATGFTAADAIILITDGNPTTWGPGTNTSNTVSQWTTATANAQTSANALKSKTIGTVYGIGAGGDFTDPLPVAEDPVQPIGRLNAVVEDGKVTTFDDLTSALPEIVAELCEPSITIDKTATPTELPEPGGDFDFTVRVTNTSLGDASVRLTELTDTVDGQSPVNIAGISGVSCEYSDGSAFDPGNDWIDGDDWIECTWTRSFTGLPGSEHDTAHARGIDPGERATTRVNDDATITITDVPSSILIEKSGDLEDGATGEVGDVVEYDFTITNDGDDMLTGVTLDDPKLSDEAIDWTTSTEPSTPAGTLASGESVTGTGTYILTQADVDAGKVDNTAETAGNPPGCASQGSECEVTDTDDETVDIDQDPSIEIVKSGDLEDGATGEVGDVVEYDFTITNDGNVTLTDVTLDDPKLSDEAIDWTTSTEPSTPEGTLASGESVTGTGTYILTQADIDAGKVDNTATSTGLPPDCESDDCDVTDTDNETVDIDQDPSIGIIKSGDLEDGATGEAGDIVEYDFTITNDGDVTLTGVILDDPKLSDEAIDWTTSSNGSTPAGTLAPNETVTGSGTYTLTQDDVDDGKVDNTATSTGTPPGCQSDDCDVTDTDNETVDIEQSPSIDVTKAADVETISQPTTINYDFTITNAGNVTLTDVMLDDPMLNNESCNWPASLASIASILVPGESVDCTGSYAASQAVINNGAPIINLATATGTPPSGPDVDDNATDTVTITQGPAIDIEKTGSLGLGSDGIATPGDVISYEMRVTNTGNVTLYAVDVIDELPGLSNLVCEAAELEQKSLLGALATAVFGMLAPGQSFDCTATYEISQADIDAGQVDNCAVTSGTTEVEFEEALQASAVAIVAAERVTDEDCAEVPVPQSPGVSIEKATNGEDADTPTGPLVDVGEAVTWTYVITNTGNVTLGANGGTIAVTDDMGVVPVYQSGDDGDDGILSVGESWTYEASGIAVVGQYANIGTVTAYPAPTEAKEIQEPLSAEDASHYFGVAVAASAEIGDTVWADENENGVQDNGEKGISGAIVRLTLPDDSTLDTTTNANGLYLFAALEPGTYKVELILSSIPDPADGDLKMTTAGSFTVQLAEDEIYLDADFGVTATLPTTGISADQIGLIALVLMLAGGLVLLATRSSKEDEGPEQMAA